MTDLEKYELVNKCETIEALQDAVGKIMDNNKEIEETSNYYTVSKESTKQLIAEVVLRKMRANTLTRKFGIRQQALYLQHYYEQKKRIKAYNKKFQG